MKSILSIILILIFLCNTQSNTLQYLTNLKSPLILKYFFYHRVHTSKGNEYSYDFLGKASIQFTDLGSGRVTLNLSQQHLTTSALTTLS